MKKLTFIILTVISFTTLASPKWTGFREVGLIYTYNDLDSLYVYLKGESCPSKKNYFSIIGTQQKNAKQLISMILTAKSSKKKVNIYYGASESEVLCYIHGLQIEE